MNRCPDILPSAGVAENEEDLELGIVGCDALPLVDGPILWSSGSGSICKKTKTEGNTSEKATIFIPF